MIAGMNSSIPTAVGPLLDRFGRVHDSVRLSVTDRCNLRCFYCMPETNAEFVARDRLLSFEEIVRLVRLLVLRGGVKSVRLTGGEPLVRRQLDGLVAMLAGIPGLDDLSLTTNGLLLADQAKSLREAGLQRVNVSLDTLDEDVFRKITRRDGLKKTIAGIDAAIACGFDSVKLNALALRGISEDEVVRLIKFTTERGVTMRFIEFMPLDGDRAWQKEDVLSGNTLLQIIADHFGSVSDPSRRNHSQPAEDFSIPGGGSVGIIRSVTEPFCSACNRLRITADGSIRNCLFARDEVPLRNLMRSGASDDELLAAIRRCLIGKKASHGIDSEGFSPPERPMYAIGG